MPSTPPSPQNRKPGISDTPVMQVSSGSISYGTVPAGTSTAASFTVQNVGSGILSGTVTVEPPFSVLAGGTYRLGANQSQSVTVIFSPSVAGDYSQSLIFTGGAGASATVTGSATNIPTNLPTGTTTAPHPLPAPTGFKILKVGP
jgi:hypothetical protein